MQGRFLFAKKIGQETPMRTLIPKIVAVGLMTTPALAQAPGSDPQPSCTMCQGDYISAEEIEAYSKKAVAEQRIDQQVRDIDIGKVHIALGVEHRGKLDKPRPQAVAEHDLVSEVYHIIDGTATLELGPRLINKKRRPADEETVRLYNGPGNNADAIEDGVSYHLKAGDVVVIPAGTGHLFTHIDDHIDYIMVRIDPDKITPLKDEAASKAYLGDYWNK
jgi:mannose-6-phosphate isomerase-like protein (cupin superfamily)